jgi:hypothetical protein
MTHRISPRQLNAELFASPAEWISPAKEPLDWLVPGSAYLHDYQNDPPAADGRKVILNDTDHLWGHGGNPKWVVEWYLPSLGRTIPGARPLQGGDYAVVAAPYTGDAVLYLKLRQT